MASEFTGDKVDDVDPCSQYGDIYKYFLDQPEEPSTQKEHLSTPSSSSSSYAVPPLRSMLVTGFGMRNWDSLQRALLDDEQHRQMLLAQYDKGEALECESLQSFRSPKSSTDGSSSKTATTMSESESPTPKNLSLDYLMGLAGEQEAADEMPTEREGKMSPVPEEADEWSDRTMTKAMRQARKFLREHRIFEFFQFLTTHMLSQLPENPIEFLINLLDQCLLYRSGFGNPPLLFEKPHIEQLFYLMDRMRTGFIDTDQYKTGMRTLGICSFEKNPPLSTDGLVSKDFFIDEAYECLADLLVDMIRTRGGETPSIMITPPPTAAQSFYDVDQ